MRFITVRDLRAKSAQVWRELSSQKDLVVTSNGKPVAVLSSVSGDSVENALATLRRARAMAAVEAIQSRSLKAGADGIAAREIDAEIAAVRKERRR